MDRIKFIYLFAREYRQHCKNSELKAFDQQIDNYIEQNKTLTDAEFIGKMHTEFGFLEQTNKLATLQYMQKIEHNTTVLRVLHMLFVILSVITILYFFSQHK